MRLSETQIKHIRQSVNDCFGDAARVYLFGSRVDDAKHGGDIDLYLDVDDCADWLPRRLRLAVLLQQRLGERRIDLLLHRQGMPYEPMHEIAKKTGIRL